MAHDDSNDLSDERTRDALSPEPERASGGGPWGAATPHKQAPRSFGRGPLPRGATVGRYVILDVVGEGGMGRVYSAYDPQLDRRLALKLMLVGGDPLNRPRMLREAKAMARVNHPGVVGVHDAGELGDQVYVAMDLIEGTTLGKWIKEKKRTPAEILPTFRRAGEGLAAAHAAGIVHRDFKPANVLLGNKGQVAVTDFGLAREAAHAGHDGEALPPGALPASLGSTESGTLDPLTQAGVVSGTPQYMAPEQFAGAAVDARADQFAFCVALWDALYGKPPYPAETVQDLVNRIARGDLAQPADRRKVPNYIHKALERGLSPRADLRWPSMEALLKEIADDTGKSARRVRLGAIVLLSCAVAGLGWWRISGARLRACADSKSRFEAVWTKQAREATRGAFKAALPNQGPETFVSVEASLDGWVNEWNDTHREVCAAKAGGLFDNRFERQLGCLDELRLTETALVSALARVDRASAQASSDAVLSLPLPSTCATDEARSASPTGPRASVRAKVFEATVLAWMLHPKEAEARAMEAVEEAQRSKLPAEESRAWLQVSAARGMSTRLDEAEDATVEGIWAAERAGEQRDVALAWAERMFVNAMYQAKWQAALEAGRHAETIADRIGGDRLVSARVASLRGLVLVQTGRPKEAMVPLAQALDGFEKMLGKDHLGLVRPLILMTNAARSAGDMNVAMTMSERALQIHDRFLPPVHPARATVLNARGRVLFTLGKNAEALELHKRAREMLEATIPNVHPELTKTLAMIAEVQRMSGDKAGARATFKEALAQAETFAPPSHPLRSSLERDLAYLAVDAGDERPAAEGFERALAGQWTKPEKAKLWQGVAQARINLNEWKAALAATRDGLELAELPALHFQAAQALWNLKDKAGAKAALEKAAAAGDAELKAEIERWAAANEKPAAKKRRK